MNYRKKRSKGKQEVAISTKEAQDRLGHNDIQNTLNIYTYVTEKIQEEVVRNFPKALISNKHKY